jgi:hypothetical protein
VQKQQQRQQQQRQQAAPGKAKLVEDDFVSQRPASAARTAAAAVKLAAAKQQGGTPTGTPARAAHAEVKAGARADGNAPVGALAGRQRPGTSQGRPASAKVIPVATPTGSRGQTPAGSAPASPNGEAPADGGLTQLGRPGEHTASRLQQLALGVLLQRHTSASFTRPALVLSSVHPAGASHADAPKADAKLQLQCEVEYAKLRKVTGCIAAMNTMHALCSCVWPASDAVGHLVNACCAAFGWSVEGQGHDQPHQRAHHERCHDAGLRPQDGADHRRAHCSGGPL